VAITEKHYAKYIRDDVDEQLARTLGGKSETLEGDKGKERGQIGEKSSGSAA
jgi:hypothetical protein